MPNEQGKSEKGDVRRERHGSQGGQPRGKSGGRQRGRQRGSEGGDRGHKKGRYAALNTVQEQSTAPEVRRAAAHHPKPKGVAAELIARLPAGRNPG